MSVSVTPSGTVPLNVGDTVTLRASVQNASQGVRFTTSAPAIAAVTSAGVVQALSPGEATITATAVEDSRAAASVVVRVSAVRSAFVAIQEVLNEANLPVNPGRVEGMIVAKLVIERGAATRLEVLLDSTVACQQVFTTGEPAVPSTAPNPITLSCPINTAAFDSVTGTPNHFNGARQIRARLLQDGRTLSSVEGQQIVLANRSVLTTRLTATSQAADANALRWVDGDVVVTAIPVLYNREGVTRIEFAYRRPGGVLQMIPDSVAPYSARFLESGPLKDLTDPTFRIAVSSITAIGEIGPSTLSEAVRYDNEAPPPGTITPRSWVGAQTPFAGTYTAATEADRGVGRVNVRFFAGPVTLGDSALITQGKEVARGSDLAESAPGGYRAVVQVCDALQNCTPLPGFAFGVDLAPPVVDESNLGDRAVNPAVDLVLGVTDRLSGFDARPLEVTVTLLDDNPATPSCGPTVEGVDLPGRSLDSGCAPDSVGKIIPVPRFAQGYYRYSVTPIDRAGNRGATVVRNILIDREPPVIEAVFPPQQVAPGDEGTFSAVATDNLDLTEVAFRLVFAGGAIAGPLAIPFDTASSSVGTAFDATLTTRVSRAARLPLVRTLSFIAGATRNTVLVDSLRVHAADAAGLTARASRYLDPAVYGGNSSVADPFPAVATTELRIDAARVCTGPCQGDVRTRLGVELRITGPSALDRQPFARVYFYRRDPVSGGIELLGSVSGLSAVGVLSSGQATFTYTLSHTPPAGLTGTYAIFAVGVSSGGNALRTDVAERLVEFFQQR